MFNVGDKVEHILTKDWMLVLDVSDVEDLILCRTKLNQVLEFHEFELKPVKK